jgi:hypothetical protein
MKPFEVFHAKNASYCDSRPRYRAASFCAQCQPRKRPNQLRQRHHDQCGPDGGQYRLHVLLGVSAWDVKGDVAVAFGSVILDSDRSIMGDVAAIGGDVSVADDASVGGDLALFAGDLHLAPDASIRGDRAILPGRFWLLVLLIPLLIPIGLIWLIVWIVRRNRDRRFYAPRGQAF